MSDREDFLSRWSRRKRDAGKESAPPEEEKPTQADEFSPEAKETSAAEQASVARPVHGAEEAEKKAKDEPALDLSQLPSLDSITAETDIRPFMAAGVPVNLRQAALRRVWVADPKIREFIGIAENQWDFTPGGDAPGFDFSPPTGDIKRLVAEVFGGGRREEAGKPAESDDKLSAHEPSSIRRSEAAEQSEADQFDVRDGVDEVATANEPAAEKTLSPEVSTAVPVQQGDVASQNDDAEQNELHRVAARRSHGGAMPK